MVRSNVLFREAGAMRRVSSLLAGLFALPVMLIRGAVFRRRLEKARLCGDSLAANWETWLS